MVADTSVWCGSRYCGQTQKIRRLDGWLVGLAGCLESAARAFIYLEPNVYRGLPWPRGNEPAELADSMCGIVVDPAGNVFSIGSHLKLFEMRNDFHAEGSGADIAIGAMASGASAEQAVVTACLYDAYTRDPLQIERYALSISVAA